MRKNGLSSGVALVAALALLGCGTPPPPVVVSNETRLAETDINLAQLLDQPRTELAEIVETKTGELRLRVDQERTTKALVELLPDLKPALSPPLFRSVKFSKKLGVSLPSYLPEDKKDNAVAWDLARHGDVEAARKVADPADAAFLDKLQQVRCERNYPVEWTRLVALHFFDAEMKLAHGDEKGASEIVHLHRQLDKILDAKAKAGPLGAALLPIGRRALTQAAPAFREAPFKMNLLANDIDAALKEWPKVAPQPALVVGADKKEVARFFLKPQQGRIFAATGDDAPRTLDLLSLPVPSEDVDGVIAFLDRGERLSEVLVYYHGGMHQYYPKPVHIAHHLIDLGSAGTDAETPGVLRQTYLAGDQAYQVTVLTQIASGSATTSALVRIGDAKGGLAETSLPANPRDLGAVSLDRTFDQNRLNLDASLKPAAVLETNRPSAVERVHQPIREPKPENVMLLKEGDTDLLASVAIRWSAEVNKGAMEKLAVPFWAAYGNSRIEGAEDANGGHLAFVWESDTTRYTFCLPYHEVNMPELIAADRRGTDADGMAARKKTASVLDREQREIRFKEGKEQKRLNRWLVENSVRLGMPKADVLANLPKSQKIYQTELKGAVSLYYLTSSAPEPYAASAKHLWVRFGPNDRVAEIRVRFLESKPSKDKPALFDWLRREPQGEPEALVSRWSGLWTELAKKGPTPALYRWHDDVTVITYEHDGGGSEVTLRDCPQDQPDGVVLPPLEFCTHGVENCQLGDARADVLKRWPGEQSKTPDGGIILGQAKTSLYDLVVVWFENDKVSRVVAQHRQKATLKYDDVAKALQDAWSQNLDTLGVIRRQDTASGQLLLGYGWHDDVTRVRIFGQDSDKGPRLMTEWRPWPVVVTKKP
jgi:hypothetical protein